MVELALTFNHIEGTFTLHPSAAQRINHLNNLANDNKALLLSVRPGGCAGFTYHFSWTDRESNGKKFETDGALLIIPEADLRLINGGELKYIESLSESKFDVINPNASGSCGCGNSFS
ncbi:MAG: iron-sulfur cluster assembly accessory protein [Candidatus Heimdallarchaeota archaeon]|nr:iron-sulfur cluster assembly accessory protein [Candidatus Heimdallarchaeota archaeon]